MSTAKRFEDLEIWQTSREVVKLIYLVQKDINNFAFRDQICRCSLSIMNNIAEGFERNNINEFIRFLLISKGSCGELKSMLYVSEDLGLIPKSELLIIRQKTDNLLSKLGGFIKYLRSVKNTKVTVAKL